MGAELECSPRTRGWSQDPPEPSQRALVLPAHAGMVPATRSQTAKTPRAPRARGDGPYGLESLAPKILCSPRTRGWSHFQAGGDAVGEVLPAHAGMVPSARCWRSRGRCAPRARGDGPRRSCGWVLQHPCSPRTRGWSLVPGAAVQLAAVLPAHAGMVPGGRLDLPAPCSAPRARGDGPLQGQDVRPTLMCSPRTRGWSREPPCYGEDGSVLPAHAGMVPAPRSPPEDAMGAPRARGDGPVAVLHAEAHGLCSPRTRGWSPGDLFADDRVFVLPAHAGMVPAPRSPPEDAMGAPRARGDGPSTYWLEGFLQLCSPRTRGWSHLRVDGVAALVVLPVHAGMVPVRRSWSLTTLCAPRARGDGPEQQNGTVAEARCSLRTRGWSLRRRWKADLRDVLPAHAGMVPPAGSG